MKVPKHDNIHHFDHEFAFEDLKDKTGTNHAFHVKPHQTLDGHFAQLKKQIADLSKRMERLEQLLESNT